MKIIFLNRYFSPDHSATSQLLSDLAFATAAKGWAVVVLTSSQIYDNPSHVLPKTETINNVKVIRVWTTHFGRKNLLGRFFDYATFYISSALTLLRVTKTGDIIVAKTDPPMLSILVRPIAWWHKARQVNWLHDLFPEIAEAYGLGTQNFFTKFIYDILRSIRNWSLRQSDCNIPIGQRMAEKLHRNNIPPERIRVLSNWADGEVLHSLPLHQNPLRTIWHLEDYFIVSHSGNLGRAHDYETCFRAIETLRTLETSLSQKKNKTQGTFPSVQQRISWLFIGGGAHYDLLKKQVLKQNIPNVLFYPYQDQKILAQSLSLADVHLISLKKAFEGLMVPSKFYGIAAVGRPMIFIGARQGDLQDLIRQTQCGFVVSEGDHDGLVQAIRTLAENKNLCVAMGQRARYLFEAQFNKPRVLKEWMKIFEDIKAKNSEGLAP